MVDFLKSDKPFVGTLAIAFLLIVYALGIPSLISCFDVDALGKPMSWYNSQEQRHTTRSLLHRSNLEGPPPPPYFLHPSLLPPPDADSMAAAGPSSKRVFGASALSQDRL